MNKKIKKYKYQIIYGMILLISFSFTFYFNNSVFIYFRNYNPVNDTISPLEGNWFNLQYLSSIINSTPFNLASHLLFTVVLSTGLIYLAFI